MGEPPYKPGELTVIYPGWRNVNELETMCCGCIPIRYLCKQHTERAYDYTTLNVEWATTALEIGWIKDLGELSLDQPGRFADDDCFFAPQVPVVALCLAKLPCGCVYYVRPCKAHADARRSRVLNSGI